MNRRDLVIAVLGAAAVVCISLSWPVRAAQLPCSITVDAAGNVSGFCAGVPSVPAPTPAPPPPTTPPPPSAPGACLATPPNVVMQTLFPGGTNNYVFDSYTFVNTGTQHNIYPAVGQGPAGTIQVFPLPKTWPDGTPVTQAKAAFVSFIVYSQSGAQYEVAFSRCPGDFTYYTSPAAGVEFFGTTYHPCGQIYGPDMALNWGMEGDFRTCQIDSGPWYMNWRVVPGTCPANTGYTCGVAFGVPKG